MPAALPPDAPAAVLYAFSMLGVAVFAASGALAAGRKNFDLVGVAVLGLVTATGGGTIRDVLMDRRVFWIADPNHILVALAATAATVAWVRFFRPPDRALLYADAFGLALFAVSGAQIAESAGLAPVVIVMMGTITGTAGGLLRDVLGVEVPLIFRKSELYVTTCVAGLLAYLLLREADLSPAQAGIVAAGVILGLRLASIRWRITLPTVTVDRGESE
jgi:uncharacterized membrane protein YeiH